MNPFKNLAIKLNELPQGYPAVPSGIEIKILEKLFTSEEADLASQMTKDLETPAQLAARLEMDARAIYPLIKSMAKKGLIKVGRAEGKLAFALMPFVVGIYEMQAGRIDRELALLFEEYFKTGFGKLLEIQPPVHRVIPIQKGFHQDIEIRPYENILEIIENAQSWGVVDCICRTQKALIGEPCEHPLDVCMILSEYTDAFSLNDTIRQLTKEGAYQTLQRAAQAGLVHSVSNTQEGVWYICNCCTCSCGILRGMVDFGYANVIARSSFVCQVDSDACVTCGICVEHCPFNALELKDELSVNRVRCTGCGVCTQYCPQEALSLTTRPQNEIKPPPKTETDWERDRRSSALNTRAG